MKRETLLTSNSGIFHTNASLSEFIWKPVIFAYLDYIELQTEEN